VSCATDAPDRDGRNDRAQEHRTAAEVDRADAVTAEHAAAAES
jgi:hypothetical protein